MILTCIIIYFVAAVLLALIAQFISYRLLKEIKSTSKVLYEEITGGYDEAWTKPISTVNNYTDGPMAKRLHQAIIDRKCTKHMSELSYWMYRIGNWIFFPVPYLFGLFVVFFFYVFIKGLIES